MVFIGSGLLSGFFATSPFSGRSLFFFSLMLNLFRRHAVELYRNGRGLWLISRAVDFVGHTLTNPALLQELFKSTFRQIRGPEYFALFDPTVSKAKYSVFIPLIQHDYTQPSNSAKQSVWTGAKIGALCVRCVIVVLSLLPYASKWNIWLLITPPLMLVFDGIAFGAIPK